MSNDGSRFSFLSRKEAVTFLRLMISELRKLALFNGFSGVRHSLEKTDEALNHVDDKPK